MHRPIISANTVHVTTSTVFQARITAAITMAARMAYRVGAILMVAPPTKIHMLAIATLVLTHRHMTMGSQRPACACRRTAAAARAHRLIVNRRRRHRIKMITHRATQIWHKAVCPVPIRV